MLLLYEHRLGSFTQAAPGRFNKGMGRGTAHNTTAARWYQLFNNGGFELDDQPRDGRPSIFDLDALKALIREDPHQSSRCLADRL
uniref:Mos1 transposase HTH domain-containing protein n=1 Tax=Caenorhabditis japonica TaxID=281687 RepID=A0A8R1E602_CAEJA